MEKKQKGKGRWAQQAKNVGESTDDVAPELEKVVDLASLVRRLHMEGLEEHILNIYVAGSRAYGTANTNSDWDIIAVFNEKTLGRKWYSMGWMYDHGWVKRNPRWTDEGYKRDFVGYKDLQVWIYTPDTFQNLVNQYVPFAVQCLFFPEENVWKKEVSFSMPDPPDLKTLYFSFAGVAELHFERAKLEFGQRALKLAKEATGGYKGGKKGGKSKQKLENKFKLRTEAWDISQSKKTLHHALRFLEFGCQLAERGSIFDLSAANETKKVILAVQGEAWDRHLAAFFPLYSNARERLQTLCSVQDRDGEYEYAFEGRIV